MEFGASIDLVQLRAVNRKSVSPASRGSAPPSLSQPSHPYANAVGVHLVVAAELVDGDNDVGRRFVVVQAVLLHLKEKKDCDP